MPNLIQLCTSNRMHFVHTVQRSLFKSCSAAAIKLWKYILLKTHNNTYHLQVCMGMPYCFKHFCTTDEQKLRYLTVILNYLSVITNEIWNVCFSTLMILLRNYVLAWFAHFSWLAFFCLFLMWLCQYIFPDFSMQIHILLLNKNRIILYLVLWNLLYTNIMWLSLHGDKCAVLSQS